MMGYSVIAIARKEFFDQLISRKFLLIFGILLVVSVIGILNGVSDYHTSVSSYNSLQQSVSGSGGSVSPVDLYMKQKPSVLLVFYQIGLTFKLIGGILGIAMGFDLITKEKERKSLKILLAHPVYRDQVINGKTLGGIAAIILALGCTMAVSLAILLLFGIVPTLSEMLPILVFYAATFLLIFSFFAIAILMSTLCEESGQSLVYTLITYVMLGTFIPALIMSPLVMEKVLGPAPEMPEMTAYPAENTANPSDHAAEIERIQKENRDALERYGEQNMAYKESITWWVNNQVLLSPTNNYARISAFMTNPTAMSETLYGLTGAGTSGGMNDDDRTILVTYKSRKIVDFDVYSIIAMLTGNLTALLVMPAVFFGLAYVRFMRMDIR
ncbi:ABC transporter permease subunit [Methanoregula sp.]|uniref:ABC transporter permease n=1 Tax=Methanoregula sp. TaxID=2052170 RepID=UPI0026302E6C|nr:ABC transporter permease subunit [Methanoregula sp.]MDD5143771.1 ABC transporter permease subunit [Methanoregula sp.]